MTETTVPNVETLSCGCPIPANGRASMTITVRGDQREYVEQVAERLGCRPELIVRAILSAVVVCDGLSEVPDSNPDQRLLSNLIPRMAQEYAAKPHLYDI